MLLQMSVLLGRHRSDRDRPSGDWQSQLRESSLNSDFLELQTRIIPVESIYLQCFVVRNKYQLVQGSVHLYTRVEIWIRGSLKAAMRILATFSKWFYIS